MTGQIGFWSISDRLAEISAQGDPLETLAATTCVFQLMVGADSRGTWAPVPDDRGHGFQTMLGTVSS